MALDDDTQRARGKTYDTQYEQRLGLRKEAIAARRAGAKSAAQSARDMRQQAAQNQQNIRFGASQATALGMQPGMGAGGGAIAAAGQVGREAQMAGIAQSGQDLERIAAADQRASDARVGAEEYAAQQGTEESDYSESFAEGSAAAEEAIAESEGLFGENKEVTFSRLRSIIARIRVKNPRAAEELEREYLKGGSGYGRVGDNWW